MKHHHQSPSRQRHAARPGRQGAGAPQRAPRRVSGPAGGTRTVAAAVAVPRPAAPRTRTHAAPVAVPVQRGRTGVFARLAVESVLDRVLRGRGWIWFVGVALGGIVFMQVWLLKLNTGISRAVQTTTTLERQNSGLEASIARLSAGERIRRLAGDRGMLLPLAGDVGYVTVRPGYDAPRAADRVTPPSEEARELLAASRDAQATIGAGDVVADAISGLAAPGTVMPAAAVDAAVTTATAAPAQAPVAGATAADGTVAAAGTATPAPATDPTATATTTTSTATGFEG